MRDFRRSPDSRYPDQRNDGNCNSREEAVAEIRARLNKVTLPNGERVTALGVNRESKEGPPGQKQDSRDCQATETDESAAMGGYLPSSAQESDDDQDKACHCKAQRDLCHEHG